jgi:hypothetical protein
MLSGLILGDRRSPINRKNLGIRILPLLRAIGLLGGRMNGQRSLVWELYCIKGMVIAALSTATFSDLLYSPKFRYY